MRLVPTSIAALGIVLCCLGPAGATTLQYQATGGAISGTLGGTAFSNATWTITAYADPASAVHYMNGDLGGTIYAPVWSLSTTAYLTIVGSSGTLTATLSGWDIESRDYSLFGTAHASVNGFFDSFADGNAGVEQGSGAYVQNNAASNPSVFNDLAAVGAFPAGSGFDVLTYATSAGVLALSADSMAAGTFTISAASAPVPEPATAALLGIGLVMLAGIGRRGRGSPA